MKIWWKNYYKSSRRGYCILTFSNIIGAPIASRYICMDSTLQDISMDTKNTKIGVRTKKLCKFQNLKKISKHCSTFSRRGYSVLPFSDII